MPFGLTPNFQQLMACVLAGLRYEYPLVLHLTNTLEDFLKGKDQGSVAEGDSNQVSLCSTFKVVYLGSWFNLKTYRFINLK